MVSGRPVAGQWQAKQVHGFGKLIIHTHDRKPAMHAAMYAWLACGHVPSKDSSKPGPGPGPALRDVQVRGVAHAEHAVQYKRS